MPIKHGKGFTTLTGDSIDYFRMCVLRGAVKLEIAGICVRTGPKIWKQCAREFNIKGDRQAVYEWLCKKVEELRPLQEHIGEES